MADNDFPMMMAVLATDHTMSAGKPIELLDEGTLRSHPLLDTATAKLAWAHRHLAALEHNIGQAFIAPADKAVLRADLDPETGYHVFRIKTPPNISTDWAEHFTYAVADVATNLRSALDKFAWKDAARAAGGPPKDITGVKFPICDSPDEWIKEGRARNLFVPEHCGLVEEFQPYHGTDDWTDDWIGPYVHPLTLLRNLANDDKHRDTEPVLLTPTQFEFRRFDFARREESFGNGTFLLPDMDWLGISKPIEAGLIVMQARLLGDPEPEIDDAGRAAPQVAISEGRVVVPTLQRISRFVHLFLSEFARQFPR